MFKLNQIEEQILKNQYDKNGEINTKLTFKEYKYATINSSLGSQSSPISSTSSNKTTLSSEFKAMSLGCKSDKHKKKKQKKEKKPKEELMGMHTTTTISEKRFISEIIQRDSNLTIFYSLLLKLDKREIDSLNKGYLIEVQRGFTGLTLFVPTNEALRNYMIEMNIDMLDTETIKTIISNHIVFIKLTPENLMYGQTDIAKYIKNSFEEQGISIDFHNSKKGKIHRMMYPISAVNTQNLSLLEPIESVAHFQSNINSFIQSTETNNTIGANVLTDLARSPISKAIKKTKLPVSRFLDILERSGLKGEIDSSKQYPYGLTLFVPIDSSIQDLNIETMSPDELKNFIKSHMIDERVKYKYIDDQTKVFKLAGTREKLNLIRGSIKKLKEDIIGEKDRIAHIVSEPFGDISKMTSIVGANIITDLTRDNITKALKNTKLPINHFLRIIEISGLRSEIDSSDKYMNGLTLLVPLDSSLANPDSIGITPEKAKKIVQRHLINERVKAIYIKDPTKKKMFKSPETQIRLENIKNKFSFIKENIIGKKDRIAHVISKPIPEHEELTKVSSPSLSTSLDFIKSISLGTNGGGGILESKTIKKDYLFSDFVKYIVCLATEIHDEMLIEKNKKIPNFHAKLLKLISYHTTKYIRSMKLELIDKFGEEKGKQVIFWTKVLLIDVIVRTLFILSTDEFFVMNDYNLILMSLYSNKMEELTKVINIKMDELEDKTKKDSFIYYENLIQLDNIKSIYNAIYLDLRADVIDNNSIFEHIDHHAKFIARSLVEKNKKVICKRNKEENIEYTKTYVNNLLQCLLIIFEYSFESDDILHEEMTKILKNVYKNIDNMEQEVLSFNIISDWLKYTEEKDEMNLIY